VARVIYEYYGADRLKRFEHLVDETDRFDSAKLNRQDVLDPQGVVLLGFTIDSRSGIGRFKDYFLDAVEWLKTMSLEEVLEQTEVKERVAKLRQSNAAFLETLKAHTTRDGSVIVTDFRPIEQVPIGNRFMVYTLFPDTKVSIRLQWGPRKEFVAVTLGHNIFNRTSRVNCGELCSDFGGGGHRGAAACPLDPGKADDQIAEMVRRLNEVDA
jgi:nanoRNase/pAp phosphatase (c-di-AMP/oligoRNAs hydrolase)